jgi:hypothetical protein
VIDAFGLGCVAFSDVPKAFGGPKAETSCTPVCDDDGDCSKFDEGLICVDDRDTPTVGDGRCALECKRDADCEGNVFGERCLFASNVQEDRFDLYCGEKIGPDADGTICAGNSKCIHGVCAPTAADPKVGACTVLCEFADDCPDGVTCKATSAQTPGTMSLQQFNVCR